MARPARAYEEKVKPRLKEIRKWRNEDVSVLEVARRLGVTQTLLNAKAKVYPELAQALKTRPLTEEELKRKAENAHSNRRRTLGSARSFFRNHATLEEKQGVIDVIFEKATEEEKEKIIQYVLNFEKKE